MKEFMNPLIANNPMALELAQSIKQLDPRSALRALKQHFDDGKILEKEMVTLCKPSLLDGVLFASIDPSAIDQTKILRHSTGTPGAATGKVARTIEEADKYIASGEAFILVLPETKPEFIRYIEEAAGVVTFQGGITSHAAIITRQKGKPAIIGCGDANLKSGEEITIDGAAGIIVRGKAPIKPPEPTNTDLSAILEIADGLSSEKTRHIVVKANADTPKDAEKARKLGAKGIGVVRTEHMFFAEDRLPHMQAMIMAADEADRRKHLDKLATMQKDDFKGILQAMDGLPVTIRLLDAPLHEFMPHDADDVAALADKLGVSDTAIEQRMEDLKESNPMLGLRGTRLLITHPEICEMQVRAILQAANELKEEGRNPQPQIMLPMVSLVGELEHIKKVIEKVGDDLGINRGDYKIGIMTEVPSTAWEAKEFAKHAEFFSFGTNDFTQTTYGMSRDDLTSYTALLLEKGIISSDPFQTIQEAAARGMEQGISEGKQANPNLDVSVCGEHGGDPASIHTCQKIGVDAVSVSPPRIPIARLVTAQAMLEHELEVGSWQVRQNARANSYSRADC